MGVSSAGPRPVDIRPGGGAAFTADFDAAHGGLLVELCFRADLSRCDRLVVTGVDGRRLRFDSYSYRLFGVNLVPDGALMAPWTGRVSVSALGPPTKTYLQAVHMADTPFLGGPRVVVALLQAPTALRRGKCVQQGRISCPVAQQIRLSPADRMQIRLCCTQPCGPPMWHTHALPLGCL